MSLGDSLKNKKLRTPLRKALAFLSPLLIVSAGIHSLAMLLPIPEREEIVVEEPELPESIQVSELPEVELPQPEELEPVFVPVPAPATPPVVQQPAPAPQPPAIAAQPEPTEPLQPQPTEPQPIEPQPATPEPSSPQKQEPIGKEPITPAGSNSVVRNFDAKSRNSPDYLIAFSTALSEGVYSDDESPISYEPLRDGTLTLTLPAGDNCFAEAEPVDADSVKLITSLGVVIRNDGDRGFLQDTTVASKTGYTEADNIINDAARDSDLVANKIEAWVREAVDNNGSFPFEEGPNALAYQIFSVEVIFNEHSCPDPSV